MMIHTRHRADKWHAFAGRGTGPAGTVVTRG